MKEDMLPKATWAGHLRANLVLLSLTLLIGAVVYPLAVLAVGQGLFKDKADGSLLKDGDRVLGSRLIAQEFKDDRYFQPRPSAVGYTADASGASNWSSNNPQLRDRVARQLGPVAVDSLGKPVGPEVEAWVRTKGEPVAFWVKNNPELAKLWLANTDNEAAVKNWFEANAKDLPPELRQQDAFYDAFARLNAGKFFDVQDKKVVAVEKGEVIQGAFFDLWLREHPDRARELERVPADQVMASGSGLDPHITMRNARRRSPE